MAQFDVYLNPNARKDIPYLDEIIAALDLLLTGI